jgi:hypothetical protein
MPLPDLWIDDLFRRLSVRYGQAFLRQYDGLNLSEVKRDWAEVLGDMSAERLRHAVRNMPEAVPTAPMFRRVCLEYRLPDESLPRLAAPAPDPARKADVARMLKELRDRLTSGHMERDGMTPAAYVAAGLRRREAQGMRLTGAQRDMLKACEEKAGMESQP